MAFLDVFGFKYRELPSLDPQSFVPGSIPFGCCRINRRCPLAEVHIQEGETLENALRRFKRKVLQEDIIKEVKRHAFYLKPGQKKRLKSALARKRNRKKRNRDSALEQTR